MPIGHRASERTSHLAALTPAAVSKSQRIFVPLGAALLAEGLIGLKRRRIEGNYKTNSPGPT